MPVVNVSPPLPTTCALSMINKRFSFIIQRQDKVDQVLEEEKLSPGFSRHYVLLKTRACFQLSCIFLFRSPLSRTNESAHTFGGLETEFKLKCLH